MTFDESYRKTGAMFGSDPSPLLTRHLDDLDRGKPVLDVGAGQGRNSFALARAGFEVDAIDPSAVGIEAVEEVARREDLSIRTTVAGFESFTSDRTYGTVLLLGLIPMISRDSLAGLRTRVEEWTGSGSLILITAFTVEDPRFPIVSREYTEIGKNSFTDGEGTVRTYLEPDEVLTLFPHRDVLSHWEGLGTWHRHGDLPPERHGLVSVALRR